MKVLVCGGRKYNNRERLFQMLDEIHAETPIGLIIHGDATGADTLAGEWANERNVSFLTYPIEPGEDGFARNTRMLHASDPDIVMYFPGGNGTSDMVAKAYRDGRYEMIPGLAGREKQETLL